MQALESTPHHLDSLDRISVRSIQDVQAEFRVGIEKLGETKLNRLGTAAIFAGASVLNWIEGPSLFHIGIGSVSTIASIIELRQAHKIANQQSILQDSVGRLDGTIGEHILRAPESPFVN